MLALFNSINSAVCGVLGINSYLQGVIIMVCINVIAVLGMSVLTGFTRLQRHAEIVDGSNAAEILFHIPHFKDWCCQISGPPSLQS